MRLKLPPTSYNLLFSLPFVYALRFPEISMEFLYTTAFFIWVSEFLAIHVGCFLANYHENVLVKRILAFSLYFSFVALLIIISQQATIFYFAAINLASKFFGHKDNYSSETIAKYFVVLLLSTTICILLRTGLRAIVELPPSVLNYPHPYARGVFFDYPEILLVWGLIYPLGLVLADAITIGHLSGFKKSTS